MFKKCSVVMLPTNEKAKVGMLNFAPYNREGHKLELIHYVTNGDGLIPQHLYILSDDKIEFPRLRWIMDNREGMNGFIHQVSVVLDSKLCPEIIATTDTSLTTCQCKKVGYHKLSCKQTYNLPQPSQSFIKVFIEEYNKGNVITDVMVEYEVKAYADNLLPEIWDELKINPKNNTIHIKKLKDSWSREELQKLFDSYGDNLPAKIIWEDIKNL